MASHARSRGERDGETIEFTNKNRRKSKMAAVAAIARLCYLWVCLAGKRRIGFRIGEPS